MEKIPYRLSKCHSCQDPFSSLKKDPDTFVFPLTESLPHAQSLARRAVEIAGTGEQAVIVFRISNHELANMSALIFDSSSSEWLAFVTNNRSLGPMHSFDLVRGPVLKKKGGTEALQFPRFNQSSIHTEPAAESFDAAFRRIMAR